MYANGVYIDQEKFTRDGSKKWTLPAHLNISSAGKQIVESEPNVTDSTLNMLIETDWGKISEEDKNLIMSLSKKEIFYENSEIGLTHVAQCIKDNLNQPLGELIARYSYERRIPYLLGAIYIKALVSTQKLFYYTYSPDRGYRRIAWEPKDFYVPPAPFAPPTKKKRRIRKKPLTEKPVAPKFDIYACPVCSNPAKLFRCGKNSRLWHVCCMDATRECQNYVGLPPKKTEKQAVEDWNKYVISVVDDPIWSKDAEEFEYSDDDTPVETEVAE